MFNLEEKELLITIDILFILDYIVIKCMNFIDLNQPRAILYCQGIIY